MNDSKIELPFTIEQAKQNVEKKNCRQQNSSLNKFEFSAGKRLIEFEIFEKKFSTEIVSIANEKKLNHGKSITRGKKLQEKKNQSNSKLN